MKTNIFFILTVLFATQLTSAQVLLDDNFDNYTLGNLGTDPTGAVPGQGNWYTFSSPAFVPSDADNKYFKIVAEPNRGNVLQITSLPSMGGNNIQKRGLDVLWNNRTQGNDILKVTFDFFTGPTLNLTGQHTFLYILSNNDFNITNNNLITYVSYSPGTKYVGTMSNTGDSFTVNQNTWYTFVFYIDYTNQKIYFSIPSLGKMAIYNQQGSIPLASSLLLGVNTSPNQTITSEYKFDNIVISAVNTVPLSVQDFISNKFNMFPNPASNVVTITNSENIGVEQIQVFDISGKAVQSYIFNNENQVQLNIEELAAGTYMLHIKTNEGTAVKKLVKQ